MCQGDKCGEIFLKENGTFWFTLGRAVRAPFQDALAVKIWLDLLEGLWSYEGFKLRGSGYPQIFSAP